MKNKPIKKVAFFVKPCIDEIRKIGLESIKWLKKHNISVLVTPGAPDILQKEADEIIDPDDKKSQYDEIDLAIALGGDGTILWVARKVSPFGIPVLSFNMGHLGFLAAYSINRLYEVLEKTITGDYTFVNRMMLQAEHIRDGKILNSYTAMNDVVVNKGMITRLIELETFVRDELITTYLCDGLIISTPTGSTAYSLSAGGPIVAPELNAILMTPICPHTLTNRPMVLGGDNIITIRLVSDDRKGFLTLDGQISDTVWYDDRVVIKTAPDHARIIVDPESHFFDVLNRKLKWGHR